MGTILQGLPAEKVGSRIFLWFGYSERIRQPIQRARHCSAQLLGVTSGRM